MTNINFNQRILNYMKTNAVSYDEAKKAAEEEEKKNPSQEAKTPEAINDQAGSLAQLDYAAMMNNYLVKNTAKEDANSTTYTFTTKSKTQTINVNGEQIKITVGLSKSTQNIKIVVDKDGKINFSSNQFVTKLNFNTDEALNSIDLSGLNYSRFASKMPYGQENYTRPYTNYGDFTGGSAPTDDSIDRELAQLEYNTFGTEFSNDDTQTRIRRLNSVNKAKKATSKYDSAKFQQRMSTAMEIGAMLLMILAMVL